MLVIGLITGGQDHSTQDEWKARILECRQRHGLPSVMLVTVVIEQRHDRRPQQVFARMRTLLSQCQGFILDYHGKRGYLPSWFWSMINAQHVPVWACGPSGALLAHHVWHLPLSAMASPEERRRRRRRRPHRETGHALRQRCGISVLTVHTLPRQLVFEEIELDGVASHVRSDDDCYVYRWSAPTVDMLAPWLRSVQGRVKDDDEVEVDDDDEDEDEDEDDDDDDEDEVEDDEDDDEDEVDNDDSLNWATLAAWAGRFFPTH